MRNNRAQVLVFSLVAMAGFALLLTGCGSSYRGEVGRLTEREDWEGTIPHLKVAVAEDSTDAWAWRELGRARLKLGRPAEARKALDRSRALNPDDATTVLYSGIAHESAGEWLGALGDYERCLSMDGLSFEQIGAVRTRILRATREVAQLRAVELQKQPGEMRENYLAVYTFTIADTTSPYQALRKGVAAMLITDLSNVKSLRLVERLQLETLIKEVQRGAGGALDPAMQVRAGKMIGARRSIAGTLVMLPGDEVQLQYYVLDNETGENQAQGESRGDVEEVLRLEKEIAYGIIDQIGIVLTKEERRAIGRIPTTSFPAFLAYSEGVDMEDRGRFVEAHAKYEQALQLDPGFEEAKERLEALGSVTSSEQIAMATAEFFTAVDGAGTKTERSGSPVAERLATTSALGGFGDSEALSGGVAGSQENVYPPVNPGTGTINIHVPVRN